ncbi:hypothetical protein PYW08_012906 [Mythimna loreyi]|uniref:Uncharacterized protein n=1 Tax=Mythimna loreyi TaxID=667449 RepID=A0ACC2Q541_9NEOP|nr:hypothetical protein PYW08_012906 [Mythimna loreyi]
MSSPNAKRIKPNSPSADRKEYEVPSMYIKGNLTSGYDGYVYEILLNGVIYLKLKYNDKVKNFKIATNYSEAWPFDDICFMINWEDVTRKPTIVFIQMKLKINERKPKINWAESYKIYKNIPEKLKAENGLFKSKFDEYECFVILYTNKDLKIKTVPVEDSYCPGLNDIIKTNKDGTVSRLNEAEKKKLTDELRKNGDFSENDNEMLKDFLNRSLLLFNKQADNKGLEKILVKLIAEHLPPTSFPLATETATALFIKKVTKWWTTLDKAPYLTEEVDYLNILEPVTGSLNIMYKSKIKHYTFSDDAVSSLNLHHSCTIIIAENSMLTVVKVMQHLWNEEHVVIDLESIASLQYGERKALCEELKANNENVLILVCDKISADNSFQDIGEAVKNKKRILISSNNKFSQKIKELFPLGAGEEYSEVRDEKNSLTDMSEESQSHILETTTVMFQDKEVKLADIVDDKLKKYVKGNVLHKIFIGETIVVGKLIVDSNYDKIKHFWIDRNITNSSQFRRKEVTLKTLYDIEDDVMLLTAEPGMGKTTLLTHLSIKTKEQNPKVWILRINLLEYSKEFINWKNNKTVIDLSETLKVMCQGLLYKKLGKKHSVTVTLEENDNVVYLKNCTADPLTEFELKLFLYFYFKRDVILLIDGFDEIWPHHTDVVIKCLKTIINDPRKHRVWITSRSYDEVKTILRRELELESWDLNRFSDTKYLQKFWEYTLNVEELNDTQLENVKKLLDHMSLFYNRPLSKESINGIIYNAALYLSYKIKNTHIPLWKYNKNYHQIINPDAYSYIIATDCVSCRCCWYCIGTCNNPQCNYILGYYNHKFESSSNPLILYLVAVDVENNIKNESVCDKWYLDVETYTVYERFLENKIKKRWQEKRGIEDIYISENITEYEKELADSILKHKKLAAYATFCLDREKIFSEKDLKEINDLLDKFKHGEEKTGIIVSVDEVPNFVHRTFAEHFAVEYISDCLKIENVDENTLLSCLDCMFRNDFIDYKNVLRIFDQKITIDKKLMSVLENNKDVIFKWLEIDISTFYFRVYGYGNLESFFRDVIEYAIGNTNISISEEHMNKLRELLNFGRRKKTPTSYE